MIGGSKDLNAVEMESQRGEYVLAHNGWVMNADPLINFAGEGSQVKISTLCTCVQISSVKNCICICTLYTLFPLIVHMTDCKSKGYYVCMYECIVLWISSNLYR